MKTLPELLGLRIKELRREQGYTQESMAEKVGVDAKYLSKIERGKSFPYSTTIENISKTFKIEVFELFDYKHLKEHDEHKQKLIAKIGRMNKKEVELINELILSIRRYEGIIEK